jgi:thiamine-phosphate pyrophosphorylase
MITPPLRVLEALRLVYVVDEEQAANWKHLDLVLTSGVTALWLRAPSQNGSELYRIARDLLLRCRSHGAALVVGDRADVARCAGADGVQIGHRSPPAHHVRPWFPGWMGVSCHSEADLRRAESAGADFAVLSPVYGVPSKGAPLGPTLFGRMRQTVKIPVVALGGIEPEKAAEVRAAGADGIAVIRALKDAADPALAARMLSGPMTPR